GKYLPNGALGVALAGLLAAFMAGMAANVSSFNTVFTYDIWQTYLVRGRRASRIQGDRLQGQLVPDRGGSLSGTLSAETS
ncbi:MAG TPA: hypothetical protein VLL30_27465, partial [Reyranella sp.]|nr:hypothetical protein [Reyranella sp.]